MLLKFDLARDSYNHKPLMVEIGREDVKGDKFQELPRNAWVYRVFICTQWHGSFIYSIWLLNRPWLCG